MPGNGGIGRGSVKVWLKDDDSNAPSSANHSHARADASVGAQSNKPLTFTFTFPGEVETKVTLRGTDEVKFHWEEEKPAP